MIFIATDHAGFSLKEQICQHLKERQIVFDDYGIYEQKATDYPLLAKRVAKAVLKNNGRGILLCASGAGMAITANRFKDIRAVVAWSKEIAVEAREDNDVNILVLPANYVNFNQAKEIVSAFFATSFSHEERHKRRINEIDA